MSSKNAQLTNAKSDQRFSPGVGTARSKTQVTPKILKNSENMVRFQMFDTQKSYFLTIFDHLVAFGKVLTEKL